MTGITTDHWSLPHKMLFRFFFIFLAMFIRPWSWLDSLPGFSYAGELYGKMFDAVVTAFNGWFFHIREELVPLNGSGDTSFGWAAFAFLLTVSLCGMLLWSVLDRRRLNYTRLNYWLCLVARYSVAMVALRYGIIKLFSCRCHIRI